MLMTDINRDYTKRFRGPYYDMLPHDMEENTWELVPSGGTHADAIIIGTRNQILEIYDRSNAAGTAILQI